jgi:hypothetical protein
VGNHVEVEHIFYIVGILTGLCKCRHGAQSLNKLVLISKNWPNDPCFGCESFVVESLHDFGDIEIDLLEPMEEEFENQLGDYVELDDSIDFDF